MSHKLHRLRSTTGKFFSRASYFILRTDCLVATCVGAPEQGARQPGPGIHGRNSVASGCFAVDPAQGESASSHFGATLDNFEKRGRNLFSPSLGSRPALVPTAILDRWPQGFPSVMPSTPRSPASHEVICEALISGSSRSSCGMAASLPGLLNLRKECFSARPRFCWSCWSTVRADKGDEWDLLGSSPLRHLMGAGPRFENHTFRSASFAHGRQLGSALNNAITKSLHSKLALPRFIKVRMFNLQATVR
mmetsp:Transcript_24600/g.61529  ORF Transcript_24600/g.61529 Transcript_24600/m.61529 type:complete len:249 (+) Transcript_24600:214-960(+)